MTGIYIRARAKSIRIEYNSLSSQRDVNANFEFYQPPFHAISLTDGLGVKINTVFNEFDINSTIIMAIEKVVNLDGSDFNLNTGFLGTETEAEIVQKRSDNLVNWINDCSDFM